MLLLTPVLLAFVLGIVQFGVMFTTQNLIDSACAQGSRVAAHGGSAEDIREAVKRVLGPQRFRRTDIFVTSGNEDGSPLRTGDVVEVRVELLARDVVPDLLAFIGCGLGDRKLTGRAVLRME
jgi:hypothetical protein